VVGILIMEVSLDLHLHYIQMQKEIKYLVEILTLVFTLERDSVRGDTFSRHSFFFCI